MLMPASSATHHRRRVAGCSGEPPSFAGVHAPYPGDNDEDKVDQAVLALLSLGRHVGYRTWKAFDWDVMNRLHEKGYITDPVGKAKSVYGNRNGFSAPFSAESTRRARRRPRSDVLVQSEDRTRAAVPKGRGRR